MTCSSGAMAAGSLKEARFIFGVTRESSVSESSGAECEGGKEKRHLDELLDEGLKGTFPASDPVSVGHFTGTEAPSQPVDRTVIDLTSVPSRRGRKTRTQRRVARGGEAGKLRDRGIWFGDVAFFESRK